MNNTQGDLNSLTKKFLDEHSKNKYTEPLWSEQWKFKGEIPNQAKQGVYAFLDENSEVVYIGVGASKGGGIYEGAGLGSRLGRIWKKHSLTPLHEDGSKLYEKTDSYKYIHSVVTFALEPTEWYLAYALEYYLISKMLPTKNKLGK